MGKLSGNTMADKTVLALLTLVAGVCAQANTTFMAQSPKCCTECQRFGGSCGGLADPTDCWNENICFANDADECCSLNTGKVAGLTVAMAFGLLLAGLACCFLPRCPLGERWRNRNQEAGAYTTLMDYDGPA